jgi:ribulose-phosphate 3-epimerase
MALIAPSLLAADFARLGEALDLYKEAGAALVHVDVMDGHFVPDLTVGPPVIRSLRKATDLTLDLHLMVERPDRYAPQFVEAGADRIAIHAEAAPHLHQVLGAMRAQGVQAGLAVNPATAIDSVTGALDDIDYLLILAADLGYDNAAFIPGTIHKVLTACALRRDRGLDFAVQVEGCIGLEQIEKLREAGADILVADSDIFKNGEPRARLAEMMRRASRQISSV